MQEQKDILDGEEFFILSKVELLAVINDGSFKGKPIVEANDAKSWLVRINDADDLTLGLHCGPPLRGGWWWTVLAKDMNGAYHRVELQRVSCEHCSWQGWLGTPVSFVLYSGSPRRAEALDLARLKPIKPCPSCGASVGRHAFWIGALH